MVIFTKLCSRFSKVITGASLGAGIALLTYGIYNKDRLVAYAQWNLEQTCRIRWDENWDRQNPVNMVRPPKNEKEREQIDEKIQRAIPSSSRHLFLIRHGQYNLDGQADSQRGLTQLGQDQADLTGLRLKEFNHPFTHFYHSSMKRAHETAQNIHKYFSDLTPVSCDLLREGAPVPPEPAFKNWRPEAAFYKEGVRIEAAFRKYFHRARPDQAKDSYEIIVCHANVIRYFVCRALQLPAQAWLRMSLNNGSITMITIRPDGTVSLKALGDSGHIPAHKVTYT